MLVFEYTLIFLAAVLLSNLINRFVPSLSTPIIQIILGVLIAFIPFGAFGFRFELEPELFFVMFIAPFVFYSGMTFDKKTMMQMIVPIIGAAVVLVFIVVISVGYFVHLLIPAIPLTVAFALIASLGPTDDVAVAAVAKRVSVPRKIMGILSGESLINDASGIISFQFAIIAATIGGFSLPQAVWRFFLVGIGGIFAGLILTFIKYVLVRWLRSHGIENVTFHILLGILTPFVIYMIAENMLVSGILAVFAAGIAHSVFQGKFNPEMVKLNIAQEIVWSVLIFTLEGLVFILLGTQLPDILKTINNGEHAIDGWQVVGCVFALMAVIIITRFLWWVLTVRKKTYQDSEAEIGKIKSGIIFSLAGARGAVTLASVMSIPAALSNGAAFPERELVILLASGVIIISMLITNFILPLFIARKTSEAKNEAEQDAYAEIIRGVTGRLISEATEETNFATAIVIRSVSNRIITVKEHDRSFMDIRKEEKALMAQINLWEKENVANMLNDGKIDKTTANLFLERLEARNYGFFKKVKWLINHALSRKSLTNNEDFTLLWRASKGYILEKLNESKTPENSLLIDRFIIFYDLAGTRRIIGERHGDPVQTEAVESVVSRIALRGFQIERGLIQEMFEAGRISWKTAKEMRQNIKMVEARLQSDDVL